MTTPPPRRRLRAFAINTAVVVITLALVALLCEFVVFRFVWPGSDVPRLDFANGVVRYAPNQTGVWRVRDEIEAPYSINAQGWNSGVGDYVRTRTPGVRRVAVIGDSYVEALHVPSKASVAETLARAFSRGGETAQAHRWQVYRFGISGAPLSQYVHMAEREVADYRPDWLVVVVVHNDFDESFRFVPGRYTSSFLKFRIEDGKVAVEVPPAPWQPDAIEWWRRTATARFLLYRWQVRPQAIIDLLTPRPAAAQPKANQGANYEANIDVGQVLGAGREIAAVADHAVSRLTALANRIGARLLLVMDGSRQAIYEGRTDSPALTLNRLLGETAKRYGAAFLDLHPVFAAHWAANRRRFEFASDNHWNELGHAVAGEAIAERIRHLAHKPADQTSGKAR